MAIFRTSAIVGAVSGNIGGACFVNGRGSKVLRQRKTKKASVPTTQQVKRNIFQRVVNEWREFTANEKEAWATYAKATPVTNRVGERSALSGYQSFLKIRMFRYSTTDLTTLEPPLQADKPLICPVSFSWSVASGCFIETLTGPIAGNVFINIGAMSIYTTSQLKFWGRYKQIVNIIMGQNVSTQITTFYENEFPTPVVGQTVAFRARFMSGNGERLGETTQIINTTA